VFVFFLLVCSVLVLFDSNWFLLLAQGGDEAVVARIGPWGGAGNALHDIAERPHRLQRVTIFSGTIVNSLEYLYSDGDGQQHTAGPWGGCGGTGRKVSLISQSSMEANCWCWMPRFLTALSFYMFLFADSSCP
jgi:hypothetical protein